MAKEKYFPFRSISGDRKYSAEDWAAYFAQFIGNGVFYSSADKMKVAEYDGMKVKVQKGAGFIAGRMYLLEEDLIIKLDTADGVVDRVDRIVLRCDYNNRLMTVTVKKGGYGANPTAPELTRDTGVYELALADVYVAAGAVTITAANITDQRFNTSLCGIVTGLIEQADTEEIFSQFQAAFTEWFDYVKEVLSEDAAGNLLALINTKASNADLQKEVTERKNEVAVERARIDALTKMEEGSTTGDVELQDIRIGVDGVTYETAGAAVRAQASALAAKIEEEASTLSSEIVEVNNVANYIVNNSLPTTILPNKAINTNTGAITENAGYISVMHNLPSDAIYIKTKKSTIHDYYRNVVFYNSNGVYISPLRFDDDYMSKIPEGACSCGYIIGKISDYVEGEEELLIYRANDFTSNIESVSDNQINVTWTIEKGTVNHLTGEFSTNENYYRIAHQQLRAFTNQLLIPEMSNGYVSLYSGEKTYIKSMLATKVEGGYLLKDIPTNAQWYSFIISKVSEYKNEYRIGKEIHRGNIIDKINDLESKSGIDYGEIKVFDFFNNNKSHSEAIDDAIAFSRMFKNRTIVFDTIDWYISKAILLPSNTTVIIDGVSIVQNDNVYDNVFRGDNLLLDNNDINGMPLEVFETSNIKILGKNNAKIIGCNVNATGVHSVTGETQEKVGDFWGWRTFQICLSRCNNFEVGGLYFEKTRCWCMSFDKSSNGHIHDITVMSNVKNGDGIDIRSGCHDIVIENIYGNTSDDTVALTAINLGTVFPVNNYQYPLEPSSYLNDIWSVEDLGIKNVVIRNIKTTGYHHGVICLSNGGFKVSNVLIENVEDVEKSGREANVKIYSGYGSGYTDNDISNIRINNVVSNGATYGLIVTHKVNNVWANKIVQNNPSDNSWVHYIDNTNGVTITNS